MLSKIYDVITILLILGAVVLIGYVYWNREKFFPSGIIPTTQTSLYENLVPVQVKVPDKWVNYAGKLREKDLYALENTEIILYAASLNNPTTIEVIGDYVVIAETTSGNIVVLRDTNGDKSADEKQVFESGLSQPYGISYYNEDLYVATDSSVIKYPNFINQYNLGSRNSEVLISNLPSVGLHGTKTLIAGPNNKILVHIGSSCNDCIEGDKRRGSLVSYDLDGTNEQIYSTGLKHVSDMEFWRGELFALDSDMMVIGDEAAEEINKLLPTKSYGWPFLYNDSSSNTKHGEIPVVNYSAPIAMLDPLSNTKGISLSTSFNGALVAFSGDSGFKKQSKKIGLVGFDSKEVSDVLSFWTGNAEYISTPHDIDRFKDGWLVTDTTSGYVYYFEMN